MPLQMNGLKKGLAALFLLCLALTAGCAGWQGKGKPAAVPEIHPGLPAGYLPSEALPNSLALIPPPPAQGSAAFALDEEVARKTFSLPGTPRFTLALSDYDLSFPHAAGTFSCALKAPITKAGTPYLYQLLHRTLTDAALSTYTAKNHYQRPRPFMLNKEPICAPQDKGGLEKDPSYPSGHTAIGWTWALILTEIAPDRTDALLARGRAYGESRNVCNHHWNSDVVWGRFMGAATVARLHADPGFRADLEAAKGELAAVRAQGLQPTRDCQAEADALAQPWQALIGEAKILQSWQGDFPVAWLNLLPEGQGEKPVGFIGDAKTFEGVWKAFKPNEAVPSIDFKENLVLFARNTQFYNRIAIGKVSLTGGLAEVMARETLSALPIEDKVALSLALVARQGISGIRTGGQVLPVNQDR